MNARRTRARLAIAAELLTRRGSVHYGYDLSRRAGVGAGSMYPFLTELLEAGYVEAEWEAGDADRVGGKPRRRYYRITDEGEEYLRGFVGAHPAPTRTRKLAVRPAEVPQ